MSNDEQGAPCQWPVEANEGRPCGKPSVAYIGATWMDDDSMITGDTPVCREHFDESEGRST